MIMVPASSCPKIEQQQGRSEMTTATEPSRPFTGWHMLAILVAFFGVIISVNLLMASYASSSWSGLISKDTYVASQDFNIAAAKARRWEAEGFSGKFTVRDNILEYRLKGPAAAVGHLTEISAIFHRPVGDKQDFTIKLTKTSDGNFTSGHNLPVGQWIVDLAAIDKGDTVFHEAERIYIAEKKK
jgi:nitrogen fixation protein FixH